MFQNNKILILGLARSGYQAAKLLIKRGNNVYLNDAKEEDKQDKNQVEELRKLGLNINAGKTKKFTKEIKGDIVLDKISTLDLSLSNGSTYTGTINGDNTAKSIAITLDDSSTLTLTGDSYITTLTNSTSDNSNINLNGYKLYINGVEFTK